MQFVYHKEAGKEELTVDVREYEHIFKVRRTHLDEVLSWRNLEDSTVYEYKITAVGKKEATLTLVSQKESRIAPLKELHVGWCVIDPKIIEKTLPMLNELGVTKISFKPNRRSEYFFCIIMNNSGFYIIFSPYIQNNTFFTFKTNFSELSHIL